MFSSIANVEPKHKQDGAPAEPNLREIDLTKKRRKRPPRKFVSPCLATSVSELHENNQQVKNSETDVYVEQRVPQSPYGRDEKKISSRDIDRHGNAIDVNIKSYPQCLTSSFCKNMDEENFLASHGNRIQISTQLSTTHVSQESNLNFSGRQRTGKVSHTLKSNVSNKNSKNVLSLPPTSPEGCRRDLSVENTCSSPTYEPHSFAATKLCVTVAGYEYVPNSNPGSPQIVPTEGTIQSLHQIKGCHPKNHITDKRISRFFFFNSLPFVIVHRRPRGRLWDIHPARA